MSLGSVALILIVLSTFHGARAATASANLRIETPAKLTVAELESKVAAIKMDRKLLDEVAARLALQKAWGLDADETARQIAAKITISIRRGGAAADLEAEDGNPVQAAVIANTAASVLRDHFEASRMTRAEMDELVSSHEADVAAKLKTVSEILRTQGIIYDGDEAPPHEVSEPADERAPTPSFAAATRDLETARLKLEELIRGKVPRGTISISQIRWAKAPEE